MQCDAGSQEHRRSCRQQLSAHAEAFHKLRGVSSGLGYEPTVEQLVRDGWTIESYRLLWPGIGRDRPCGRALC